MGGETENERYVDLFVPLDACGQWLGYAAGWRSIKNSRRHYAHRVNRLCWYFRFVDIELNFEGFQWKEFEGWTLKFMQVSTIQLRLDENKFQLEIFWQVCRHQSLPPTRRTIPRDLVECCRSFGQTWFDRRSEWFPLIPYLHNPTTPIPHSVPRVPPSSLPLSLLSKGSSLPLSYPLAVIGGFSMGKVRTRVDAQIGIKAFDLAGAVPPFLLPPSWCIFSTLAHMSPSSLLIL